MQWYNEPWLKDHFEYLPWLVVGFIYFFLPAMGIEDRPNVWVESALTTGLLPPSKEGEQGDVVYRIYQLELFGSVHR